MSDSQQRSLNLNQSNNARAAFVHLNFPAGSTFPVPVCTVPHGHLVNQADNQQE